MGYLRQGKAPLAFVPYVTMVSLHMQLTQRKNSKRLQLQAQVQHEPACLCLVSGKEPQHIMTE